MTTHQITIIRNAGKNVFKQSVDRKEVSFEVQANDRQDAMNKGRMHCIKNNLIDFNGMEMVILVDGVEERGNW